MILLHTLVSQGPSQKTFYDTRRELSRKYPLKPPVDSWITELARAFHRCYIEQYAKQSHLEVILSLLPARSIDTTADPDPSVIALEALLSQLRMQARLLAWRIFRSSYLEIGPSIWPWLAQQLLFDLSKPQDNDAFDAWILDSEKKGELSRKEGATDRWVVKIKR